MATLVRKRFGGWFAAAAQVTVVPGRRHVTDDKGAL
jgi:hypothetical protein